MTARVAPGDAVRRVWAGLRWYLRAATGEDRWDDYLARCAREGRRPMTRREFERHRADQREHAGAAGRCC